MTFTFNIPTDQGDSEIKLEQGDSIIFLGANGAGKTRLAVHIENALGKNGHRIAAHRAIELNPEVQKITEERAKSMLFYGHDPSHGDIPPDHASEQKQVGRWRRKSATHLLNDFDFVMQALFAEQANTALKTHTAAREEQGLGRPPPTKFEQLQEIFESLLPHRKLRISSEQVDAVDMASGKCYSASEMSDGERTVFYMLGQALVAPPDCVLILDEPELHMHPSILGKLWDKIQGTRQDCGFVFITHDLNFAANRFGQKFVVKNYKHDGPIWSLDRVPEDTGFDEAIVTLILGSRRPVLFVEGENQSIDVALYSACFPEWTVIPRGSCKDVIHSVRTMLTNSKMTHVTCRGFIDADDHIDGEIPEISVLPVSEIENLILLPDVAKTILQNEGFKDDALDRKFSAIVNDLIADAVKSIDKTVMLYCHRRIDSILKKINLRAAKTPDQLANEYALQTQEINVQKLAQTARENMQTAIDAKDLPAILKLFKGKGKFMTTAAKHLKSSNRVNDYREWLIRVLRNDTVPGLLDAIRNALPKLQ
ncbi:DUF4435 domain-containing protein [Verminephrobacter aporrectodeae subsp. tuberculatae]|uniref:DUF4435 domain-containing protein n=1 Tax=Verminephrobacter aporrectodeae TaxID=1110389 RepID=UPI0022433875|nr:AAA family ATPase [Verminephrobacter aporrectodeae]MCW8199888.1 DUF4435 domain-containing protein [Verminephrobacter aporrectodeae subsp. tuberculatae]